jgi:hypothetical protein
MVVALPAVLGGCEHAVVGNAVALGMTCCLFFGTLQLGRRPAPKAKESKHPNG